MRALALALTLLSAAPAYAQSDEASNACFTELPLTAALVADTSHYGYGGHVGSAGTPAFVIGALSPTRDAEDAQDTFGSVLFIRDDQGAWRAMLPRVGESVVATYANGQGGIIIATMWTSEGPGGQWMLLRSNDGLRTASCGNVAFPDTLNNPYYNMEFLEMHDLDINARGRGEIIGFTRTEDRGDLWFSYTTRDHGATWASPRAISRQRDARRGNYTKIDEDQSPDALVAELTAYAATRLSCVRKSPAL